MANFILTASGKTNPPLIMALYGESGTGKTFSALKFAEGLVRGEEKREGFNSICVIDTEQGRSSMYHDYIDGGFSLINLDPPFSSERIEEAFAFAIKQGFKVVIIDSLTQEWAGEGGVLERQALKESESGSKGDRGKLKSWGEVKAPHNKLITTIVRSPVHVICTLRAKDKVVVFKNSKEHLETATDGIQPIQQAEVLFEFLVNLRTLGHGKYEAVKVPENYKSIFNGAKLSTELGVKFSDLHVKKKGEGDTTLFEVVLQAIKNCNTPEEKKAVYQKYKDKGIDWQLIKSKTE